MGEYLHYALAAAKGGVYAGIDGIGYVGVFGTPALYTPNNGWVDLPCTQGFQPNSQIYGSANAISHDGSVVAGSVTGTTPNGVSKQVAAYWVNGAETVLPDPPDDPGAITVSATAVSGDGTTLLVQDGDAYSATVETFVYNIAGGTFTSLGFLGSATFQTFATAINGDGTVVAGYSSLDDGNINGFIWTVSNGVTVLGVPPDFANSFFVYLEPTCMSDDGTTLFGRLTDGGGWVGFRYNTTTGYQDLALTPSACTADGTEVVGLQDMYFPAVWSASNGGGFLDYLVSANIAPQAFPTLGDPYSANPVTISPDGTAITALGPDFYPADQIWYGVWQISLPFPLKTAAIPPAKLTFYTDYQTTLTVPAGTLTQNAQFNTGVSATLVKGPRYASAFVLHADGSFSYTPKPGYISAGTDPENGTPTDRFTYKLTGPNGTSSNAVVLISVSAPMPPTVDTPTYANVTTTSATLGGTVEDGGGSTLTAIGVVYAPTSVDSYPQIVDGSATTAPAAAATTGVFTVSVSNLLPNTTYSYAAYAINGLGISYSFVDSFTTAAAPMPPTVDTPTYAYVTTTGATLGGTVETDGGATITDVGVVYAPTSVDSYPQIGDGSATTVPAAATTGVFTVGVTNLLPNTSYSYAAYAINSLGISYSFVDSFTTAATPMPPTVDTPTYANVTATSATLGGTVESDGGATIADVGVVYAPTSVDGNPQIGDAGATIVPAAAATIGVFTVDVSNLLPNTTYSYAAYATNSFGISYSFVDSFITPAF